MDIALARSELERLQRVACINDHKGNENNSNKSVGDVPGSANAGNSGRVGSIDGSLPPTETKSGEPRNRA